MKKYVFELMKAYIFPKGKTSLVKYLQDSIRNYRSANWTYLGEDDIIRFKDKYKEKILKFYN